MAKINAGRFTATIDGEFVVFIIGMRFNKLWKVHQWGPVVAAMPTMLKELMQSPSKGLLHIESARRGRTVVMIQYWRSYEDLERFARNTDDPHLPAWRRYNQRVGSTGDVGVYHETYRVSPGSYEAVYANMPTFGLAKAGRLVPVGQRSESARERLSANA